MRIAFLVALALPALLVVHGTLNLLGGGSGFDSAASRIAYGMAQVVAGAMIAAGLLVSPRAPRFGLLLVLAAVVAISALMYWFAIVTIPVGVALAWVAHKRGQTARESSLAE